MVEEVHLNACRDLKAIMPAAVSRWHVRLCVAIFGRCRLESAAGAHGLQRVFGEARVGGTQGAEKETRAATVFDDLDETAHRAQALWSRRCRHGLGVNLGYSSNRIHSNVSLLKEAAFETVQFSSSRRNGRRSHLVDSPGDQVKAILICTG